ncbi:hypothetical protein SLH46_19250 [Draconibacterium sp. IB214405]|uniref:hypothetical protein n=1 Tax=Draconibacterium sp. IB214405 TaxID=3097352 RepID=UPI002A13CCB4|nr:hypothetical protein [Draconibacterium sp. IB214405]MDX8341344.1 hypothetical protein [Draconibacterium sp. IB214405]
MTLGLKYSSKYGFILLKMKLLFVFIIALFSANCYAQPEGIPTMSENESFQIVSQPNPYGELSLYLKENIDPKLLKNITYPQREFCGKTIRLEFQINKRNITSQLRIRTGVEELDDTIKSLFVKFPIEKLHITEANKLGKNSVQLISRKYKKNIINASTIAVCDQMPIVEGCEDIEYYYRYSSCFYKSLYEHILNNISLLTVQKSGVRGEIKVYLKFSIDVDGNFYDVSCMAPKKTFRNEIIRVVKTYSKIIEPGMRNAIPAGVYDYKTVYLLVIDKIK